MLEEIETLARAATRDDIMAQSRFAAACSPERILAILARVRELEEALKEALDGWDTERDTEGYDPSPAARNLRSLLARGDT